MKKNYTIEQMAETRWFYNFTEPNAKGETLTIELTKCEDDPNWKNSNPKLWKKNGYTDRVLETYWSISTYVRDTEGNCYGRYNVRRRITIGCNSKLNSRLIPIRLRSRACNRTLMSA